MKCSIQFLFFLLICSYNIVHAQNFIGTVLNAEDKSPVPFATVYFSELESGTSTSNEGVFLIEHYPQKKIAISISSVGFKTLDVVLDLSKISTQTFYLQPTHIKLEEVIVSVPGGKLKGATVANVSKSNLSELNSTSAFTLSDAISNIAGVDQITTGARIGKPVIRGLSGSRIVTYTQGVRVENQQWGEEHALGVGSIGIESVEVIKGPASLLYGSDAIGGVIYFNDERYAKHDELEVQAQNTFDFTTQSNNASAGFKIHKEDLKLNLFAGKSASPDYVLPSANRVFNSRFNESNLKAALGFNKSNWITNIRYSYINNQYGITDTALFSTTTEKISLAPAQYVESHLGSIENTLFVGESKFNLILATNLNNREEYEGNLDSSDLNMKLLTHSYNLKWFSKEYKNLDFILGSQGLLQTNKNFGEEILIPDASTQDVGAFVLSNISVKKLKFQVGVRADSRKISLTDFSPTFEQRYSSLNYSLGANYSVGASIVRANISTGFRAPISSELFSDGVHESALRYEIGNQNLVSEKATQLDLSYEFENEHLNFIINPFVNSINNYIYLQPKDSVIDGAPVFEYVQTNALLTGGELGAHFHPHGLHWLHLESSLAYVLAQDGDKNPLPLIPATSINSTVKTEFEARKNLYLKELFVRHIYKLQQQNFAQFETSSPSYQVINAGAVMSVNSDKLPLEISLGVKNVFNTTYIDHLSRFKSIGIPMVGRSFYIGAKLAVNKKLNSK